MFKLRLIVSAICVLFVGTAVNAAEVSSTSTYAETKSSPWGFSFSTSYKRNFDHYSNAVSNNAVGASYKYNKDLSLSINSSYDTVLSNYEDNPRRKIEWGMNDVSLGGDLALAAIFGGDLNVYLSSTLPFSRTSHLSGLRASFRPGAYWVRKFGRAAFTWNTSFSYSNYEFETANAKGTVTNIPLAVINSVGLAYSATDDLSFAGSAGLTNTQNFKGREKAIQFLGVSSSYKFLIYKQKASASLGYGWADRIISNNQLFDDDTSAFTLGLGFSI